ncbi:MAG: hypothetical protein ACRD8Z_26725 [Nitrososphaeraceae archaeon]
MRTTDTTLGILKNNDWQQSAHPWGGNLRGVIASDQVVGPGKSHSKDSLFDY